MSVAEVKFNTLLLLNVVYAPIKELSLSLLPCVTVKSESLSELLAVESVI